MASKKDIVDDFVSSLVNSDSIKKAEIKRRRELFASEIKKTVRRINATGGTMPNLDEATEILNTAASRIHSYDKNGRNYLGKEDEAVQNLARAYGGFLLGLGVMRDSTEEQPEGEVKYFLGSIRKDLLENYDKIKHISRDYLGFSQDPLFVLEKNANRSLNSKFAYNPNKDLLKKELRYMGANLESSARRKGLESTLGVVSLLGSLLFFSSSITGNAIAGYNVARSNISAIILLVLALLFGYLYFKRKVPQKIKRKK